MILVRIGSDGVEAISFEGCQGVLQDPAVQLWPLVQRELSRLDRAVKRSNCRLVRAVRLRERDVEALVRVGLEPRRGVR